MSFFNLSKRIWLATVMIVTSLSAYAYPFENPYETGAKFVFKINKHSMYWTDRRNVSDKEFYEFWTVTSYDESTGISHIEAYATDSLRNAYAAYSGSKTEISFDIKPQGDGFMRRYEGGDWNYLYSAEKAKKTSTSSVCGYTLNTLFFEENIKESSSVTVEGAIIANPEQEDWNSRWSTLGLSYYYYHYYNVVGNNIETRTNTIELIYAETASGTIFSTIKKPRVTNSYAMYDPDCVFFPSNMHKVTGAFEIGFKTDPNALGYKIWFYDIERNTSGYLSSSYPELGPNPSMHNRFVPVDLTYDLYDSGYQWGFWSKPANSYSLQEYGSGIWLFMVVPYNLLFQDDEILQTIYDFEVWATVRSVLDDGSGRYLQNELVKRIENEGKDFPFLYVVVGDQFNYTEMARSPLEEETGIKLEKSILPILYPNPASDYVTIVDAADNGVNILDFNGRCIWSGKADNGVVNVSSLDNGVYVVRISDKSYQLIIQR